MEPLRREIIHSEVAIPLLDHEKVRRVYKDVDLTNAIEPYAISYLVGNVPNHEPELA